MQTNKGLYILSNNYLETNNFYKFGMSMNLDTRWHNYNSVFSDPYYIYCYEFLSHNSKYEICYIEKTLLEKTKDKHAKPFQTEYREFTKEELLLFHKDIIEILNKYKIKYILHVNPKFSIISNNLKEQLDNSKELEKIDLLNNPFDNSERNIIQEEYIKYAIKELNTKKKCLIVAPTGFGKTHIIYKIMNSLENLKIIIFFTPRIILNEQTQKERYYNILEKKYNIIDYSYLPIDKKKNIPILDKPTIIISCYQSANSLYENITKNKIDLCIFDETHIISSWTKEENKEFQKFWLNSPNILYRLFATATPKYEMINNPIFGNVVERIKIYDLIKTEILCNIETIGKKITDKKAEYIELSKIIEECMIKYKKKKGVIYVNTQENAKELYKLMTTKTKLKTYIYISQSNIELVNEDDDNITNFEKNKEPCVIINCQKISYGYDNDLIDFICFGDPRQSDISIRQICGRGLRWNKSNYPNKILHILLPIYIDEFGEYTNYDNIKAYLDYIINECGQDIINSTNSNYNIKSTNNKLLVPQYSGDIIPPEICNDYCTTGYNMYSKFLWYLSINKVVDEKTYNELQEKNIWMPIISNIRKKYKRFCFRDIDPNKNNYYTTKEECINAIEIATNILKKNIGMKKYYEMKNIIKLKNINMIDKKIPKINYNLYFL
jgi:superfamily II DNA or RNA helicase